MPKKKEIKPKNQEQKAPALDLEQYSGQGFENTSSQDLPTPFLNVLQSNSPQVDDDDERYVEGAKAGHFYNTATGELFQNLSCVIVSFRKVDVEWRPNRGGYVGEYPSGKAPIDYTEGYKKFTAEGNEIVPTVYYNILFDNDGDWEPGILAFSSTSMEVHRKWQGLLTSCVLQGKNGPFVAPIFGFLWELTTTTKSNSKGKWKQIEVTKGKQVDDPELFGEVQRLKQIADVTNRPKPQAAIADNSEHVSDDIPF